MESAFNDTLIANVTTGTASAVSRVVNYKDSSGVRIDSTGEMAGYNTQAMTFTQHLDENGVSYLGNTNAVLWPDSTSNNWIATSRVFQGAFWFIMYGNGIFVAQNDDGILASSDGLRWQKAEPLAGDTDFDWMFNGASDGNIFVSVGDTGRVASSADGLKWTLQTAPSISGYWQGCTYTNGKFFIGSSAGDIAYSTDGITWASASSPAASVIFKFYYLGGTYFASGPSGLLMTSPDGVTWTQRTSTFGTSTVYDILFNGTVYVAVGEDGKVATSSDGMTWTARSSGVSSHLICAQYFSDLFVAAGFNGGILTSADGLTWSSRTNGFGSNNVYTLTSFKGLLVASGGSVNATICTSTDGTTWTTRSAGNSSTVVASVAVSAERAVGVCTSGQFAISTDGITWAQEPVAASGIQALGAGVNNFMASNVAGQTYYSKDGYSWALGNNPNSGVTNAYAKHLAGAIVAVGDSGSMRYAADTANMSWTDITSSFGTSNIYGIAADNTGVMVAVGAGGKLARATSLTSWTQQTSSFGTDDIFGVAWSTTLGLFIAVGNSGKLATSPDGITWTQRTSSFGTTKIGYIAVIGGTVVAAAGYGSTMVASSTDGTTWTQRTNTTAGYGLFASSSKFVLLGADAYADSSDGTTWSAHTHDQFKGTYYAGVYGNLGVGAALLVAGNTAGGITVSAEGAFVAGHTINGVVLSPGEGANGVVVPMVPSSGIAYSASEAPPRLLPNSIKIAFNPTGNIIGPVLSDRIVRSLAAGTVSNDLTTVGALSCGLLTSYISPSVYTEVSSAYHTDYTRKLNNLVAGTGHKLTLAQAVDFAFPLHETTANITHLAVFHTSSGMLAWVVPLPSAIPSGTTVAHYQFSAGAFTLDFADASTVAP